jgi:hypothetical protein
MALSGVEMLVSAEVRWFWSGRCPQPVRDWFFKSGLPPGGGFSRIDRYGPQQGEPEISLKKRGERPGFEVKGLVATRGSPELEPLAPHIEIWCKWSCLIPGFNLTDKQPVTKTRWLRQFDTSKYVRAEIPLDANEKPKAGYSLPVQGCNVELTEVQMAGHSGMWWTLGFEAFGDLDSVPTNLTLTVLPEKPLLLRVVGSGAFLSYPAWLRARRTE